MLHPIKYYKIVQDIKEDCFPSIIAHIKYLSSKYEQEAYGEELYNELMYYDEPPEVYFRETNSYMTYNALKKCIKIVQANKDNQKLLETLAKWEYNYNDFLKKSSIFTTKFYKKTIKNYCTSPRG